jgi:hypothetical protein
MHSSTTEQRGHGVDQGRLAAGVGAIESDELGGPEGHAAIHFHEEGLDNQCARLWRVPKDASWVRVPSPAGTNNIDRPVFQRL